MERSSLRHHLLGGLFGRSPSSSSSIVPSVQDPTLVLQQKRQSFIQQQEESSQQLVDSEYDQRDDNEDASKNDINDTNTMPTTTTTTTRGGGGISRHPLSPLTIVSSIDEENSVQDDDEDDSSLFTTEHPPDCPICLDAMSPADLRHPLQCSNHCGYNFCRSCIQSLISSSQDDYVEASDGSRQVKIFLHCPQCRADLSTSIRDTVLLRKASEAEEQQRQLCNSKSNTELRDSLQGMQEALMHDVLVKDAVEEARLREMEFFGYQTTSSTDSSDSGDGNENEELDDGAWGVEADLINGVHQSFHSPRQFSFCPEQDHVRQRVLLIDFTLLGGLADFMTEHQQEKITDLFTSGDTEQLVQGAELLRGIAQQMNTPSSSSSKKNRRNSGLSRRASIYGLIADAQKAHLKAQKKNNNNNNSSQNNHNNTSARVKFLRRQMEMELREQAEYASTHPLPVRMPKSVELTLSDKENDCRTLHFVDDVWDGTIDCFNKVTIGFDGCVVHKNAQGNHKGVRYILDSDVPIRIALETGRVVVSSVTGKCARQGVLKGDVLTHVNGELWTGSVAELEAHLESMAAATCCRTIRLAFNCGPAVAEALKRRSLVP